MSRVVMTFQPQFVAMVVDGTKPHTIRKQRKRPVKVGDHLSLRTWNGPPYRSTQTGLREATCTGVEAIRISYSDCGRPILLGAKLLTASEANDLAQADGFDSADAMMAWFAKTHALPFHGVLIQWDPSAPAPVAP